jgi:hypothetical protein
MAGTLAWGGVFVGPIAPLTDCKLVLQNAPLGRYKYTVNQAGVGRIDLAGMRQVRMAQ